MKPEQTDSQPGRQHWAALLVALALLAGSGLGYRALADRLAGLSGTVLLPKGTLGGLAMNLGEWAGEDAPLDERVVQATDTDDHLSRVYRRRHGTESVTLFVAYGIHFRDLMPHRPEVCYPGAGWTLEDSRRVDLRAGDGTALPVQVHDFSRGGMDSERIVVLNYYDVDGRYCPDVSLLRSKSWRPTTDIRYMAQVQITCAARQLNATGEEVARDFAVGCAPAIRALLSKAVEEVSTRE